MEESQGELTAKDRYELYKEIYFNEKSQAHNILMRLTLLFAGEALIFNVYKEIFQTESIIKVIPTCLLFIVIISAIIATVIFIISFIKVTMRHQYSYISPYRVETESISYTYPKYISQLTKYSEEQKIQSTVSIDSLAYDDIVKEMVSFTKINSMTNENRRKWLNYALYSVSAHLVIILFLVSFYLAYWFFTQFTIQFIYL